MKPDSPQSYPVLSKRQQAQIEIQENPFKHKENLFLW